MTNEQFGVVLDDVLKNIESVLRDKAREYSFNSDRLSNFKDAATMDKRTPLQCLDSFMLKHRVAFKDYINCDAANVEIPLEWWREKIFDQINYLILAWALVLENRNDK